MTSLRVFASVRMQPRKAEVLSLIHIYEAGRTLDHIPLQEIVQ